MTYSLQVMKPGNCCYSNSTCTCIFKSLKSYIIIVAFCTGTVSSCVAGQRMSGWVGVVVCGFDGE